MSDARLTYEGVDAFLRERPEVPPAMIRAAYELSLRLEARPPGAASWSSAAARRSSR